MGKLPKIVLMIVAMTAIFLWLSTAFNSCGTKADDLIGDSGDFMEETTDDMFVDDSTEDIFENGEDEDFYIEEDDTEVEYVDDPSVTDFTEPDPIQENKPATTSSAPAASNSSNGNISSGNSYGEYMVIAGNYLVETNANLMAQKLNNLGYGSAGIAIFDNSQYHTVIASRHSSYSEALAAESAIKRKGVDCYVKRKEY